MTKDEAITAVIDKATGRTPCNRHRLKAALAVLEPEAAPAPKAEVKKKATKKKE